jgi:hypothetical protein
MAGDRNNLDGSSKNTSGNVRSNEGKTYSKDTTKPDGDACREDGTLKEADEMVWPNSPSDEVKVQASGFKDGDEQNDLPNVVVSMSRF